jgi:ABC-2 type transport system permease protein
MIPHRRQLDSLFAVFRREMLTYLTTPTAYVFVAVFLFALGALTFEAGRFFEVGRADLSAFFGFAPWAFMLFLPAVAMRLWAEERRSGMLEVLLSLPAPVWVVVLGKFLAAWALAGIALVGTFPLWITVNLLGHPDNSAIAVGYVACMLMAGGYLAIGQAMSALTGTQVIAFVLAVLVAFLLTAAGTPMALNFLEGRLGAEAADALARTSILTQFEPAQRGIIELRAVFYFVSLIAMFLTFAVLAIEAKREG